MAAAYGLKKQSHQSGEASIQEKQDPYLLPKISMTQNRNLLKKKNTHSLTRLETVAPNVYGSDELASRPKLYSSTSERRLVSFNDSKVNNTKPAETAYQDNEAKDDIKVEKRRLTLTSLTELPSE